MGVEGVFPSTKSLRKIIEYEKWWSEVYELCKEDIDKIIKGT